MKFSTFVLIVSVVCGTLIVFHIFPQSNTARPGVMSTASASGEAKSTEQAYRKAGSGQEIASQGEGVYYFSPTDKNPSAAAVHLGEGVYYFSYTRGNFGNALSNFLSVHTNLEVTAMTGNMVNQHVPRDWNHDSRYFTTTVGYFVTFRDKK